MSTQKSPWPRAEDRSPSFAQENATIKSWPVSEHLAYREYGQGRPLIILHGLFGSGRNWQTIARHLADHYRVLAVDLRNHGDSHWSPGMSIPDMAGDLRVLMDRLDVSDATIVGHSLGGKTAMWFALTAPRRVARLVVVDIAPIAYAHSFMPQIEAMRAIDLSGMQRRAQVEEALAATIDDPPLRKFLAQNAINTATGLRWRINIEAIAAAMSELLGFPDLAEKDYPGPALFVAGETSDYLRSEHMPLIVDHFPNAEFAVIAGAGHRVHADQPGAFLERLLDFLEGGYA